MKHGCSALKLSSLLFILFWHSSVVAVTHYVDSSCEGCDSTFVIDDINYPYQSLTRINSAMLNGEIANGDVISLKRGEIWRESLRITTSGVTVNAYSVNGQENLENPLIMRTNADPHWAQHTSYRLNGGFEQFNTTPVAGDFWPLWRETINPDNITPDDTTSVLGKYSARITRDSSVKPILLITKGGLPIETEHFLRFHVKTTENMTVEVFLRNRISSSESEWYTTSTGWQSSMLPAVTISPVTENEWKSYPVPFLSSANPVQLEIWFKVTAGTGSVWIDELLLDTGIDEPAKKYWAISSNQKIYGMLKDSVRVSTDAGFTDSNLELLEDGHATYYNGSFFYRNDSGDLSETEIGARFHAIAVESQNNVTIDSIDVMGPGSREVGIQYRPQPNLDTGNALIFITPGSSSVEVANLTASQGSSTGVSAGIFKDANNPTDITYKNIRSHGHESTGIYLRGSGSITDSIVYDIALAAGDSGDGGGIGLQDGPTIISDNEIYSTGSDNRKIDFAISICCSEGGLNPNGLNGAFEVTRNYIHDVANGGIQIAANSGPYNHLINNNIINRYGQTQYTGPMSTGTFAAMRIRNAPNTKVYNNVMANGGEHTQAFGLLLTGNTQNTDVKNNIFYELYATNIGAGTISGVYADVSSWSINNNIYFRTNNQNPWKWGSDVFSTLSDWQNYWLVEQGISHDNNSVTVSPEFQNLALSDVEMFALTAGSYAIDNGVDVALTTDYLGNQLLGPPDIGAYEFGYNDSDSDGLIDYDEVCFDGNCKDYNAFDPVNNVGGTDLDINNPDTDGDGYSDGTEIGLGSNPLNVSSTPVIAPDGDINLNGEVNAADLLLAQRSALGLITLTNEQIAHADFRPSPIGDGVISVADLVLISQIILASP